MTSRWDTVVPAAFVAWSVALCAMFPQSAMSAMSAMSAGTGAVSPTSPVLPPPGPPGAQAGGYIGTAACIECHDEEGRDHAISVHVQTERGDWPAHGCEACHGPGARHLEDTEDLALIVSFDDPDRTAAERSGFCLSCHDRDAGRFDYRSSDHAKGAIDCAACHKPHAAAREEHLLPTAGETACLACHQEVRAAIALNERHRILEGMVTCTDCHEQHAPSARARLGGFKQETCIGCHTDKGGPFVFEHPSSRIEGCTSCHAPHGSTNRHLLLYQSTADLCFTCHIDVPGFHTRFDATTNCANCHSSIHGSNLDPTFLR